jgi:hypothetical protein
MEGCAIRKTRAAPLTGRSGNSVKDFGVPQAHHSIITLFCSGIKLV